MNYTKKTKPALWTQVAHVAKQRKDLEAALKLLKASRKALKRSAALRNQRKAAFSGVKRGKVAARPPKRLKPRSSAMEAKMKFYRAAKCRFLEAHPLCQCGCGRKSKEVHHMRGRAGSLLLNEFYWIAMTSECHAWVHNNIEVARERNLIAQPGQWNNPL